MNWDHLGERESTMLTKTTRQNAKCNVNPGLSHFERCALACARLLAKHLRFAFRQSKATLPYTIYNLYLRVNYLVTPTRNTRNSSP